MSLYIDLFHGRKDPNENPEDWGFEGPVLGPFDAVQITYMGRVQLKVGEVWYFLPDENGLIKYNGVWYGDWVIFTDMNSDALKRLEPLSITLSRLEQF